MMQSGSLFFLPLIESAVHCRVPTRLGLLVDAIGMLFGADVGLISLIVSVMPNSHDTAVQMIDTFR